MRLCMQVTQDSLATRLGPTWAGLLDPPQELVEAAKEAALTSGDEGGMSR